MTDETIKTEEPKVRDFDREIRDKKAEAFDIRMSIDNLNLQYQQKLAPLEARLNQKLQEIEQLKHTELNTQPNIRTEGDKIVVGPKPGDGEAKKTE